MGRAPCCDKDGLKKGPWTPEEDQKLIDYINKNGCGNWRTLPKNAGLQRCGKSCRLRWTNYLRPDIKRGRFSFEEEETIIQLHAILGNKWSAIAARLPGRTDNEIKNYWNTHIRKRLLRMGIDPVTHSPRLDLLDLSSILNSSLYGNSQSQVNFSRLLGMQNLINPDLIRLASSILTSQRQNQENCLMQNQPIVGNNNAQQLPPNQIPTSLVQNLAHQDLAIPSDSLDATHCVPITQQDQEQLMQYDNVQGFQHNLSGFGQELNDWQQTIDDYVPFTSDVSCYPRIHDPAPSSDNSTFEQYSNCSNSVQPVFSSNMSTRSSSPAMNSNSNSNYVNGSSVTEDEKESYSSSSMFKFEIPDNILDVSDYYM